MKNFIFSFFLFCQLSSFGQNPIIIEGIFEDWDNLPVSYTDATGDAGNSGIDFQELKIYDTDEFIFILLETGEEINLQNSNDVTLCFDTDNNVNTGTAINGIGADLVYNLGQRQGLFHVPGGIEEVYWDDLFLVSAPTVTSSVFEIALKKGVSIAGNAVFPGDQIEVVILDNANGDLLPNTGFVTHIFEDNAAGVLPSFDIPKQADIQLRMLSYNVKFDGFFESNKIPSFTRLLQTIQPDLIGFQEIYDHSSLQVATQVEIMLPSGPGEEWFHASAGPDIHAVSRYPILETYELAGSSSSQGNGAFLIDIPGLMEPLLYVVAHTPCCTNDAGRQSEVDAIMGFIRDAKNGTGSLQLPVNAPIVIVGDMNFVGEGDQLETLLTGNILTEFIYGPDFNPDWDGSNFVDAVSPTTGMPMGFTWFNEGSSYGPGRLDFTIYSGSVMNLENSYSFYTRGLSQNTLDTYGLYANDGTYASDHFPLVADFTFTNYVPVAVNAPKELDETAWIAPNPSLGTSTLYLDLAEGGLAEIKVVDVFGKCLLKENHLLGPGNHEITMDGSHFPIGFYLVRVKASQGEQLLKWVIGQ